MKSGGKEIVSVGLAERGSGGIRVTCEKSVADLSGGQDYLQKKRIMITRRSK